jgi:hypothetical protein
MISTILPSKKTYTIAELFDNLPMSQTEFSKRADVARTTIDALIHKRRPMQRQTVNKILNQMSQVYGRTLNLSNVTGIQLL